MGLDMYLMAKRYFYDDSVSKKILDLAVTNGPAPKSRQVDVNPLFVGIEFEVAYWRKANEIHKWFVENVQNGIDDCNEYDVSEKHMEMLLGIVREVLDHPELAKNLLPTQEGFFFGSTEYDEDYFDVLRHTEKMLTDVLAFLKDNPHFYLYYKSSW